MRDGTWWRPDRLAWWMGGLFAIGSLLFLVPALASLGSSAPWIAVTFFAGSVFFTVAASLQWLAATEIPHALWPGFKRRPLRPRAWMPAHVDWISAAVQWPGTILFNVNTFEAIDRALNPTAQDVRVWGPDMIGSGCFLFSALLAFANVEHRWLSFRPRDLDWWIAFANLVGAIAFGVSALAAYVRGTGTVISPVVDNLGTAVGAVGFLAGALLLIAQADLQERRART